ncbi:MAG: hydroxyethylthiazole kinase [Oscillospiraceae bacterium]|nr:hydroxyethylthiazole kinase [Oscillospiraceae bacterium]
MITPEEIFEMRCGIRLTRPLIHCITNPVSINDCANAVLALGAKPIMAEYEGEMPEITSAAKALSLNLGGISEAKMDAMEAAAETANKHDIPFVIDLVGVGCSSVRREFAKEIIKKYSPSVIKGNQSEIFAICGLEHHAKGIDSEDSTDIKAAAEVVSEAAGRFKTVALISGKTDLISDSKRTIAVENGSELMPYVTGMGCVLGVLTGSFLSVTESSLSVRDPFDSAVSAAVTLGLAGEFAAEEYKKTGSLSRFHGGIIDGLFAMDKKFYTTNSRYHDYET